MRKRSRSRQRSQTSRQSSSSNVPPEGIDGLISSMPVVASPDGGGERVAVEPPLALVDDERDGLGDAAREVDAVDDACVRRVGDDHLVARVHGDEEGVRAAPPGRRR